MIYIQASNACTSLCLDAEINRFLFSLGFRDENPPEGDKEGEFPPWRALVQLSWSLLRPGEEAPKKRARLPQLADVGPSATDVGPDCFPDSPLVTAALQASMEAMWGKPWSTFEDPASLPPAATCKPQKWVHDFKRKYYIDPHVQSVPGTATKFSSEEMSLLKRGVGPAKIKIPMEDVSAVETLARHALVSLGSVDWLFGTLRKLLMDRDADASMIEQTWAATLRALRHSTQWVASTVASSTVTRRKAFLAECNDFKVPVHARPWLQFQPLPSNQDAMFGNCLGQLRTLSQTEGQARMFSWAASAASASTRSPASSTFRADSFRADSKYSDSSRGSHSYRGRGSSSVQRRGGNRRPFSSNAFNSRDQYRNNKKK